MTDTRGGRFMRRCRENEYKGQNSQAGFNLFELTVVIIIIGVLSTVLLERLLRYQEYAEKTAMEVTVRNMRTGLRLRVADLMLQDRMGQIGRLLNENPIMWLEAAPPNYIGELKDPRQNDIPSGNWYFDLMRRELVYLPYHHRFFELTPGGESALRYRVSALAGTQEKNDDRPSRTEGLSLMLINQYKWDWQSGGEKSLVVASHTHSANR